MEATEKGKERKKGGSEEMEWEQIIATQKEAQLCCTRAMNKVQKNIPMNEIQIPPNPCGYEDRDCEDVGVGKVGGDGCGGDEKAEGEVGDEFELLCSSVDELFSNSYHLFSSLEPFFARDSTDSAASLHPEQLTPKHHQPHPQPYEGDKLQLKQAQKQHKQEKAHKEAEKENEEEEKREGIEEKREQEQQQEVSLKKYRSKLRSYNFYKNWGKGSLHWSYWCIYIYTRTKNFLATPIATQKHLQQLKLLHPDVSPPPSLHFSNNSHNNYKNSPNDNNVGDNKDDENTSFDSKVNTSEKKDDENDTDNKANKDENNNKEGDENNNENNKDENNNKEADENNNKEGDENNNKKAEENENSNNKENNEDNKRTDSASAQEKELSKLEFLVMVLLIESKKHLKRAEKLLKQIEQMEALNQDLLLQLQQHPTQRRVDLWVDLADCFLTRVEWFHRRFGYSVDWEEEICSYFCSQNAIDKGVAMTERFGTRLYEDVILYAANELSSFYSYYCKSIIYYHKIVKCLINDLLPTFNKGKKNNEDTAQVVNYVVSRWGRCLDKMVQLKIQHTYVDSAHPSSQKLYYWTQIFVSVYETLLFFSGKISLDPIIALAMSKNQFVQSSCLEVLQHLAIAGTTEQSNEAIKRITIIDGLRKAESEYFSTFVKEEMKKLPVKLRKEIKRSGLTSMDILRNFDVFCFSLSFVASDFQPMVKLKNPLRRSSSLRKEHAEYTLVVSYLNSNCEKIKKTIHTRQKRRTGFSFDQLLIDRDPQNFYVNWSEIGEGSFGKVYIAKRKKDNVKVAVKSMTKSINKKEITTLSFCDHPNIVKYLCTFHWENTYWLVMEYCDGGTLKHLCTASTPKEPQIAYIVREILQGLAYLHNQEVIHKDVKSDNILLNVSGEIKLADFGLCGEAKNVKMHGIVGSISYMSPEMIHRCGYDFSLDIWSLGCIMIELVEKYPPYYNEPCIKALMEIATKGAPALKKPKKYSKDFRDMLGKCLRFDPHMRSTAQQLLLHKFISRACTKESMASLCGATFLHQTLKEAGLN